MRFEDLPVCTVVMPVRNEARFIERSLGAVLGQDYPSFHVLVVDGMSDDETREVVKRVARDHPGRSLQLIDNPRRVVPEALNVALELARGDVVVRVDGHCVIAPDYIRRCVEVLHETGAACVGGAMITVGETRLARGIAAAQSSRFGVGGVAFRTGRTQAGPVDTVAFGAYRREVFERVGRFATEFVRNQDDEFNYRLNRAGEVVWLDPSIRSTYYSRATLGALWRQYLGYGFFKVRVIQRHGLMSARHLAPAAFVAALVVSVPVTLVLRHPAPLVMVLGPYLLAAAAASVMTGALRRVSVSVVLSAFATMHVAYGLGFLHGILAWRPWRRDPL